MNLKALSLVVVSLAGTALGADDVVRLKLTSEGAGAKLGSYAPQRVTLSATRPASLTKSPDNLKSPMYGTLTLGGTAYTVIVDEPEGKPARLYVDTNGNGDLTDDPIAEWAAKPTGAPEQDKQLFQYNGGAMLNLGTKDKPYEVHLSMYRFDKNDPKRPHLKDALFYYRDYAPEGEATIGGKKYKVLLVDDMTKGDYRGTALDDKRDDSSSGVELFIDVNGNGRFDGKGETFDVRKPFTLGGTTYEIKDMTKDGLMFKVAKSTRKVSEVALDPDLSPGKPAPAFEAQTMDGKTVKFPGDYKGKVVMIDFWATWCPPCVGELPNVVENYEKYHKKGFEILGITLDNKDAVDKIHAMEKDKGMTWTQVYDGGGWKARVPELYGIHSIPRAILVDGDTGKIISSDKLEVRGEKLGKTIEKALAEKSKH